MITPLTLFASSLTSGTPRSALLADGTGAHAIAGAATRQVDADALYLIEDPAQRLACWTQLWLGQKQAQPAARAVLLVGLAEAIGSLAGLAERTRAFGQMLTELSTLLPPQQVELAAALAEQISEQPALAFRKATFDDLNTVIARFEGRYRHAAYVHVLAKLQRADAVTVDHVFGEIMRCIGTPSGASGATLVLRLAAAIGRLPSARRLPRFASLNGLLRHASIAQHAKLDVAMLDAIACIDDPLEKAGAFSCAVSALTRLPEQQRRLAGSALIKAFATLAPQARPAALNELLMLAALGSAPRMVERLLELIPLTATLPFHQTALVFSWMEALTAACPQREQARIYAGFFRFTNSIQETRPRQTLRRWIHCHLSRLDADGQAFFADTVLDDSLAALARLRASSEQDLWQEKQLQAFNALVDLMPSLPATCRVGFANAMCNLIRAAQRAGRPYSRALWDSFAPNLTPESQALMYRRLGFAVDTVAVR